MTQQDINDFMYKVNRTLDWWSGADANTKTAIKQLMEAVLELVQKSADR